MSYVKPASKNCDRIRGLLFSVQALLSSVKYWSRGARARNHDGVDVDPLADDAEQFCIVGAVHFLLKETPYVEEVISMLYYSLPSTYQLLLDPRMPIRSMEQALCEWNDGVADHPDILELIDKAKELVR